MRTHKRLIFLLVTILGLAGVVVGVAPGTVFSTATRLSTTVSRIGISSTERPASTVHRAALSSALLSRQKIRRRFSRKADRKTPTTPPAGDGKRRTRFLIRTLSRTPMQQSTLLRGRDMKYLYSAVSVSL